MHEHHVHTRAAGGSDAPENLKFLCPTCHQAVHMIARKVAAGKPANHLYSNPLWKAAGAQRRAKSLVGEVIKHEMIAPSNTRRSRPVSVTVHIPPQLYIRLQTLASRSKHANGRKGSVPAVILNIIRRQLG